jgi:hypothetical protein
VWVGDFDGTSQSGETRDDDDQEDRELDETEQVLKTETPLECKPMNQEGGSNTGKTNTTLVPTVDFDIRGVQDVFAEDNGVGTSPA